MAMGPELRIDITMKSFGGEPLLSDFHLTVAAGSVVALVGPSGVGKSSLLRLVAAIDRNYTGRITIGGVDAAAAPPAGFVFQDARLLPWLTALGNIRAVRPKTSRDEGLEFLRMVGLAGFADAYPHQLSGGMQRRVALARALSVNTGLLLLDEPFVSLDRDLVREMEKVIADIIESTGATVVMVTHMFEDAAMLADRAVVMTGRPARVTGDIALQVPRRARDAATVVRLTDMLAARPGGAADD